MSGEEKEAPKITCLRDRLEGGRKKKKTEKRGGTGRKEN